MLESCIHTLILFHAHEYPNLVAARSFNALLDALQQQTCISMQEHPLFPSATKHHAHVLRYFAYHVHDTWLRMMRDLADTAALPVAEI